MAGAVHFPLWLLILQRLPRARGRADLGGHFSSPPASALRLRR